MEDVGRVREEVGAEVVALVGERKFRDVLGQLPARVLPREVRVGLGEPDLRELAHNRAAGEGLGQKHDVTVVLVDVLDEPTPELERLRVRVVDPEHLDAGVDPLDDHCEERVPQALPVRGVPVDVVDVLVALGRVLGVLQRAVRAAVEPLGMLVQPRVVGRALDREVERDVNLVLLGGLREVFEVLDGSEVAVDGIVTAGLVADRPRGARVVWSGDERVVPALAVGQADRVDRRQVQDVEAELGEPRELGLDPDQPAPGPGEQLVPAAEPRSHAVDLDRYGFREGDAAVARLNPLDGGEQFGAEGDVVLGRLGNLVVGERGGRVPDQGLVGVVLGRLLRHLEEQDALGDLAGELVVLRGDLALELVAPGPEHIGPGLHRVLPAALSVDVEAARPADAAEVGVDPLHLRFAVVGIAGALVADDRAEEVVAVAEDVGLDPDGVADAALGGVQAAVDGRGRVLDDNARRRV